jgi:hypothetical protein
MSMTTASIPRVERTVEHGVSVSLADFKVEEVAEYLREQGYSVDGSYSSVLLAAARNGGGARHVTLRADDDDPGCSGLLIDDGVIARLETLVMCGQGGAVRDELLRILCDHLGRVPA